FDRVRIDPGMIPHAHPSAKTVDDARFERERVYVTGGVRPLLPFVYFHGFQHLFVGQLAQGLGDELTIRLDPGFPRVHRAPPTKKSSRLAMSKAARLCGKSNSLMNFQPGTRSEY